MNMQYITASSYLEALNLLAMKAAKDLDDGGTKGIDYFSLGAADAAAFDFSLSARC